MIRYPTQRGERAIAPVLPLKAGARQGIIEAARKDGCTDIGVVVRQLDELQAHI
jgi:hypothetical protein